MVIAVMLVHDGIVLGEKKHKAAHGIGETPKAREIADIHAAGLEHYRNSILAHDLPGPFHPVLPHALHV